MFEVGLIADALSGSGRDRKGGEKEGRKLGFGGFNDCWGKGLRG